MAVNLAARHAFFLSSSSAPLQIQHNPSCSLRNLLKFPSRKIPKNPISGVVCATADAAAVAAGKVESLPPLEVGEIDGKCKKWVWKGYAINYFVYPEISGGAADLNPPLLLVHGFGASIAHWRRNIPTLAQSHTVYAIDLIGFGASDKPAGFQYTMEVWAQLILDFLDEVVQRPTVLLGNSIGSLACVIAAAESSRSLVRAIGLLNCAGGMNNKAVVDDWRIKLLLPLLWLFDFLLKQRGIASYLFDRARQRENLRNVLSSVYGNKEFVDEDLVEIIRRPTLDEGALDAFVSIITGPPGPTPIQLMPQINMPVLLLWGDQDPFTPIDGPVGKYFSSLPARLPTVIEHWLYRHLPRPRFPPVREEFGPHSGDGTSRSSILVQISRIRNAEFKPVMQPRSSKSSPLIDELENFDIVHADLKKMHDFLGSLRVLDVEFIPDFEHSYTLISLKK